MRAGLLRGVRGDVARGDQAVERAGVGRSKCCGGRGPAGGECGAVRFFGWGWGGGKMVKGVWIGALCMVAVFMADDNG